MGVFRVVIANSTYISLRHEPPEDDGEGLGARPRDRPALAGAAPLVGSGPAVELVTQLAAALHGRQDVPGHHRRPRQGSCIRRIRHPHPPPVR